MGEIVSINGREPPARPRYIGTKADYEHARAKRAELMWSRPIMDEEITEIDKWLIDNPHAKLSDHVNSLSRAIYCTWLLYSDPKISAEKRHHILLTLRLDYRAYEKFPKHWQEALDPMWRCWAMQFIDEEIEEQERANA
jgi:hypothetical protein